MAKDEKVWHPNFIKYMSEIISHPNYDGLSIRMRSDGSVSWIATAKSSVGRERILWCADKAKELGIEMQPGVYADVMLAIHPTKKKVCQTCGKEMSLFYHYPNANFLNGLNDYFGVAYTMCDHISDIWDGLVIQGVEEDRIAKYLIDKGALDLSLTSSKFEIIDALEYKCRKGNKKCLGPGAMSNFPDRFDGFHTYNRCCRAIHDKGRSKENLKTYTKDRRAYEYWSDGNIHAANQFMGSAFFKGVSADHIGPISLGFVHDPRYLQAMMSGDNSAKRDRLQITDIEKVIETEKRTGVYPMSWYSNKIWEYIRKNYANNMDKVSGAYRDALKQNMSNFMYILWYIMENCPGNGKDLLVCAYLRPKFKCFDYSYEFNALGEITKQIPRHNTDRNKNEIGRYCRIAIEAVYDYMDKNNRNTVAVLNIEEQLLLDEICKNINMKLPLEKVVQKITVLVGNIQDRIINTL